MNKKCVQILQRKFAKISRKNPSFRENERGFTFIEMSIAMVFLAFMLLFIATVILQMVSIYNKGIVISRINAAGQQMMTDLNGSRFNGQVVAPAGQNRICVNGVSYLWNLSTNHMTMNDTNGSGQSLVRVLDPTAAMCNNVNGDYPNFNGTGAQAMPANVKSENINNVLSPTSLIQEANVAANDVVPKLEFVISTSGSNAPAVWNGDKWTGNTTGTGTANWPKSEKSLGYVCGTNNFCAFVKYEFVVYQRG